MKFYLLFFALAPFLSLSAQTNKCSDFKNGKFKMTYRGRTVFVDRLNDLQTERYPEKNITIKFKVNWIDACHYTLTPLNITKGSNTRKDAIVDVTIDSTTSNSYFQTATSNFNNLKIEGEMIKVGSITKN